MNPEINVQTQQKSYRNTVLIVIAVLLGLLILLGIFSAWYVYVYQGWNPNQIEYRDPKYTDAEKEVFRGRIKQGEQALEKATTVEDKFKYSVAIGAEYYSLGEFLQAREWFTKATEILPENPTAWAELYRVENEMGNYIRANRAIDKAIALNDASAPYWLAKIAVQKDKLGADAQQIKRLYEQAIEKTRATDVYTSYAGYLETQNDLPGAVAQWKKAIELNSANTALYQAEITRIQEKLK